MLEYFYVVALGFPGTVLRQIKQVLINKLINFTHLQFETTDLVGIPCSVYQHKSMLADVGCLQVCSVTLTASVCGGKLPAHVLIGLRYLFTAERFDTCTD